MMLDWWAHNGPPVYVSVAGYLGLLKPRRSKPGEPTQSGEQGDLNELLKMAGPGGVIH